MLRAPLNTKTISAAEISGGADLQYDGTRKDPGAGGLIALDRPSRYQFNVMHATSCTELLILIAPGDLVPQIGQRDVGTEARDQAGFAVLTGTPAALTCKPDYVAGVIAGA